MSNNKELPEDIREGYSILKKIGYDNDSITTTELWVAESIFHLRDSEVEGLKKRFEAACHRHVEAEKKIQQQADTINELQEQLARDNNDCIEKHIELQGQIKHQAATIAELERDKDELKRSLIIALDVASDKGAKDALTIKELQKQLHLEEKSNEDLSGETYRLRKTIKELLEGIEMMLRYNIAANARLILEQLLNKYKTS